MHISLLAVLLAMFAMVTGHAPTEDQLREAVVMAAEELENGHCVRKDNEIVCEQEPRQAKVASVTPTKSQRHFATMHRSTPRTIKLSQSAAILEKVAKNLMNSPDHFTLEQLGQVVSRSITGLCDEAPSCEPRLIDNKEFRTANGCHNNLLHPLWGSPEQCLKRLLDPQYKDGLGEPRTTGRDGDPLPNARDVSLAMNEDLRKSNHETSHMLMQFGQFMSHEITMTAVDPEGFSTCTCGSAKPECFNVPVPPDDPDFRGRSCLEFPRSIQSPNEGCSMGQRQQFDQVTAFVDASNVYGHSEEDMNNLSLRDEGEPEAWRERAWPERAWRERAWPERAWRERAWPERAWRERAWPERAWRERAWRERAWRERAWPETAWRERAWHEWVLHERAWHEWAWNERVWREWAWHEWVLHERAWPERAWRERAWPERAWRERAWPERAWRERAWPERAWRERAWPERAWRERAWPERAWRERAWRERAWRERAWRERAWRERAWPERAWRERAWPERAWRLLKSKPNPQEWKKDLLPEAKSKDPEFQCPGFTGPNDEKCSLAGDNRVNQQPALTSLHTVFMREHNRIARELSQHNGGWDDNRLFYETRKIIGALMQKIAYGEYLPLVLGPDFMDKFDLTLTKSRFFDGYDPTVNPGIYNVFATAAYRFGHSIVQNEFDRYSPDYQTSIKLAFSFFNPTYILNDAEGGPDSIIRGLTTQPRQDFDRYMVSGLTKFLFADPPGSNQGFDLATVNIQRGRDHGLPGYNAWRVRCGLKNATTFTELKSQIPDETTREKLASLYRDVEDIDLFVSGLAEESVKGGIVGPTFAYLIGKQFQDLRRGDRFWFEKDDQFTEDQLAEIKKTSLARILCDNMDGTTDMQPNVFKLPTHPGNKRVPCASSGLPQMDLSKWQEWPDMPEK
ncbi:PXDN [Branchiostoma lanceolatum]|uniref:PXDN protein n=1 Tax=Branchiostoma lanceolatum TaxID=7740 RepID=A0A8J9VFP0_BRALA|nr:PXDN [Branchiostoma lanceolatum]